MIRKKFMMSQHLCYRYGRKLGNFKSMDKNQKKVDQNANRGNKLTLMMRTRGFVNSLIFITLYC